MAYASAIWGQRWQWRASEKSASHIFCVFLSPLRINIDNSVLIHPAQILKTVSHFRDPSPHTSCLFIFFFFVSDQKRLCGCFPACFSSVPKRRAPRACSKPPSHLRQPQLHWVVSCSAVRCTHARGDNSQGTLVVL